MHTISPIDLKLEFFRRPRFKWVAAGWIASAAAWGAARVLLWQDRARERGHLARMDDRQLRDIGLSRADVVGEISKRFWQA